MSNLSMRLRKVVASLAIASLLSTFLAAVPVQGAFSSYVDEAARGFVDEAGANTPSSRYEAVAIMNAALDLETCEDELPFTDVPADHSNRADVQAAFCSGLVFGEGGQASAPSETFNGDEVLNRAEYVAMMSRALGWADADLPAAELTAAQEAELEGEWYAEYAMQAYAAGVIRGFAGEGNVLGMGRGILSQDAALMACRGIGACETPMVEEEEEDRNDGRLSGGAGSIESITQTSSGVYDEVQEGEEEVPVLGLEIEADGSDLALTSFRVVIEPAGTGAASDKLEDYVDTVSVWFDGEMVGEADADEFSENDDIYTQSISLDRSIVRENDEERFYVAVTAIDNMDSADLISDALNVSVTQVRYEDATGAIFSESALGLPVDNDVDFEDALTSGDLEFKIGKGTNNPDEGVVEVADSSDTEVTVLEFTLRPYGEDMVVDSIPVLADPSAAASLVGMVDEFLLMMDGDELDSVTPTETTVGANEYIIFTDLDDDLDESVLADGETVTLQVVAVINGTDDTAGFADGDSLTVSLNAEARDADDGDDGDEVADGFDADGADDAGDDAYGIDLEADGDQLLDTDRRGTALGEELTFYEEGIAVAFVSSATPAVTTVDGGNDYATFSLVFDVTAVGNDFYISDVTAEVADYFSIVGATFTEASSLSVSGTETEDVEGDVYYIEEGDTRQFTLTVTATYAAAAGFAQVVMEEILYGTDDSPATVFDAGLDKYKTSSVYIGA